MDGIKLIPPPYGYGRILTDQRRAQGFTSQEELDAFYAAVDGTREADPEGTGGT